MKTTNYIYLAAAALALASCSNDEPGQGVSPAADGAAVVTADIAGVARSRAHDTAWDAADQIGISGYTGSVDYLNIPYTTASGDGSFSASNGVEKGIFFQNNQSVSFSAYYPYNAAVTADNPEIAANTSNQSQAKTFDFLFASGATASLDKPAIKFTNDAAFSHRMTQLVIKVTPDGNSSFDASTALTDGTATLSGLKSEGSFDTATGLAAATGDAADWTLNGNVTPSISGTTLTYVMILFPQEVSDGITYSIEYDGATYSCTLNPALAPGKRYTYNVTLRKTGLTVGTAQITDWEDDGEANIEAGITDPFNGHEAVLMREATDTQPALYFATCNIGAENPEDAGLYFWWGDVIGYDSEHPFNFVLGNTAVVTWNKSNDELLESGIIDSELRLTPEYDAAHVQWGSGWRMPTKNELDWLVNSNFCNWEEHEIQTENGAVKGWLVTSNETGSSIFLPKAGYWGVFESIIYDFGERTSLWSSQLYTINSAYRLWDNTARTANKGTGMPIRPVIEQ